MIDTATDTFLQRQVRRTDGIWTHTGKLIVRASLELQPPSQPPGALASLILPDGIITTQMIAPNAVQEQVGSFDGAVSWTMPTANVWTETPIQTTVTLTGAQTRIEFAFCATGPTKGQLIQYTIMVNGALPAVTPPALGVADIPENAFLVSCAGTYYVAPAAGSYRLAVGLYGPAGVQLSNTIQSTLYVTEQKR